MTDSTSDTERGGGVPRPTLDPQPRPPGVSRRGLLLTPGGKWRPINLIWLIWSVFFFFEPIERNTLRDWLAFVGAYACFLAIYLLLISVRSGRVQAALLLALAVLGCAYAPMNAGACGMFIYVAAIVSFVTESLELAGAVIAVATLATALELQLLHAPTAAWVSMAFLTAGVGIGNLVSAMHIRANKRLGLAQDQIENLAKLAERERIARDMHDVLGHTLSVVVLKSELAGKLMGSDAERAHREIGEVEQIARQALAEVREAIRGYRAEGIAAEIARARGTLGAAGVSLDCHAEGVRLDPSQESVLSLVLREAVTNILRHAGATNCRLELAADGRGTHLSVHDNGRGASGHEGNGIRGMRERIEALGGRLEIESTQGTRLTAEIPHGASAT
ncbi:MAG: sensor histidine kinase [Steroidobacteraceae bacterium]